MSSQRRRQSRHDNTTHSGRAVPVPNPKRTRKIRPTNYRLIAAFTFIVFMVYMAGNIVSFMNRPQIAVETVYNGTIDVNKNIDGLIIRDETVYTSSMDGQPVFNYTENEKVPKNSVICSIKNIAETQSLEEKIEQIDQSIYKIQKSRSDISIFKDDIDNIESSIGNTVDSYTYKFMNGDFSIVYALKSQIEDQINKRNQIWIMENNQSISELSAERQTYQSQLAGNITTLSSQSSGILSLRFDGREEELNFDSIENITESEIKTKDEVKIISKSTSIASGEPVFKIVNSNTWYIAAYVPNDIAAGWEVGDTKTIVATVEEEEKTVNMKISFLQNRESDTYVVFKSDIELLSFINVRNIQFKVIDESYTGIKIPNTAIIEKTLLKIPSSCLLQDRSENVVIKKTGDATEELSIKVTKADENDENPETIEYIYVPQDFELLKLGDVLITGSEEGQSEYTISDVEVYKGVYVVNTSIANFTVVDIIASNNDYSIVKKTQNGLKAYDKIVSDAKSVQESDSVY